MRSTQGKLPPGRTFGEGDDLSPKLRPFLKSRPGHLRGQLKGNAGQSSTAKSWRCTRSGHDAPSGPRCQPLSSARAAASMSHDGGFIMQPALAKLMQARQQAGAQRVLGVEGAVKIFEGLR